MGKKVFITGITGFAGSHLADYLVSTRKYEVHGTYLNKSSLVNVSGILDKVSLSELDLQDADGTGRIIEGINPDYIVHLAALPGVGDSLEKPKETLINNILVQLNVLEAVRKAKIQHAKIIVVTSADVYGKVAEKDIPIDEDTPFMPTNPYAVSKITQDYLALQYFLSYQLNIIRVRPFNHFGPRQRVGFVIADFAKQVADIEKGLVKPVMHVGNLETKRDFTDVRDIARAYALLLEGGEAGEVYNIGSGKSYKIKDILNTLITLAKVPITIETDDNLVRSADAVDRVCDSSKFRALTHWEPTISLEKSLQDTLDYWRNLV